ncbi:MAG: DUF4373 domain-containing protein [Clostridia bacterium]
MNDLYFSHDYNASMDDKILEMRSEFGLEGYGAYWMILEMLIKKDNYTLAYKDRTFNAITFACQQKTFEMKVFIDACIDIGLFERDDDAFWSNSLIRRKEAVDQHSNAKVEAARTAARARWGKENASTSPSIYVSEDGEKRERIPDAMRSHCERIATTSTHSCDGINQGNADAMRIDANKNKNKTVVVTRACEDSNTDKAFAQPDVLRAGAGNLQDCDAVAYCEQNLMSLAPGNYEDLRDFMEQGLSSELIIFAVDEACAQGKRTWGYARGVLNRFICEGVKTVGEAKASTERFKTSSKPVKGAYPPPRGSPPDNPPPPNFKL